MDEKKFIEAVMGLYQSLGEVIEAYRRTKGMQGEAKCMFPPCELDRIFHPALHMERVKEGLHALLTLRDERGNGLFPHQKLWFVVYKVFLEMDWLDNRKATLFRQWAERVYGTPGHSTKWDWDKVSAYYKQKASREWEAVYESDRPYTELARALWHKFQGEEGRNEALFVKPDRYIWHRNTPR